MTSNDSLETTLIDSHIGLYITIIVSSLSMIISTLACILTIFLTIITPKLHSPTNLLVSSTCLSTLIYLIISIVNSFIFYTESSSTDWSCRIRAYAYYVSLNLVIYSYVIQAISRLFWTVLYKYRYLLTMKCHIRLLILKTLISTLLPLSTLTTDHVIFRPLKLCVVPMKYTIHVFYLLSVGFLIPLLIITILYAIIYRHVIRSTANFRRATRDAEIARNILILLGIFLLGGIPTVIYVIVSNKTVSSPRSLFLLAVTALSVAVASERIMSILLNKEIRKALTIQWSARFANNRLSTTSVQPLIFINQSAGRVAYISKLQQIQS
ncbi:unnamed protein product [Adineta ricciae]|uniref:G-protein coupled receptors family 1 profile domain-containing protein n=1 Tax=Adineta ricciae TaxID=249248 RepID=A0A815NNH2_ADIRI|nr:unnamed protein product [Adineta ricciae]